MKIVDTRNLSNNIHGALEDGQVFIYEQDTYMKTSTFGTSVNLMNGKLKTFGIGDKISIVEAELHIV